MSTLKDFNRATGIEFEWPTDEFTPATLFEYKLDHYPKTVAHIVHTRTKATCEKCEAEGAREHLLEMASDRLEEPIASTFLLCDDCKSKLSSNESMQFR